MEDGAYGKCEVPGPQKSAKGWLDGLFLKASGNSLKVQV